MTTQTDDSPTTQTDDWPYVDTPDTIVAACRENEAAAQAVKAVLSERERRDRSLAGINLRPFGDYGIDLRELLDNHRLGDAVAQRLTD